MHESQLRLSRSEAVGLVRGLFPSVAEPEVTAVDSAGTVNYLYRVGTGCAARFPMQGGDAVEVRAVLLAEHAAMRDFAEVSTVPSPLPVAIGEPSGEYPLPWSVQTWIDGEIATPASVASSTSFAVDLAALIASLRRADTKGRSFSGEGRGGDLAAHDGWIGHCLQQSEGLLPVDRLRRAWTSLRSLPRHGDDVMSHKDLIPGNMILRDGRLAGILDTGGFGSADPALDLVAAWHMLDARRRNILRINLAIGDLEWRRGAAWAYEQAIGLVWYYADSNPTMSALGRSTLNRLLTDPTLSL
ncbi:aminoglycoside phosphotransferase family protein [Arthrobacter sp. FW306-04-A]|uniref:aminoglycoside phosphotransferase family protein n=1 Tax=Arthrobacter sp. FW306-04-A TaxID=2879619 RepID=UPI0037C16D02|nr:aminoglycoside phosphotransferase family protein [Arthrobacter sp. FW306-04-A]